MKFRKISVPFASSPGISGIFGGMIIAESVGTSHMIIPPP